MKYQKIKGTVDILPPESSRWQFLEQKIREVMQLFNYQEIRLPIFEATELFTRGIGEGTDIVNKEMYSFTDLGGRSITLRPEATASVVRAYVEESLVQKSPMTKLYYLGPMFRQEKPQKGRQRQFYQFGAEAIGSDNPEIDVELIALSVEILKSVGISDFQLVINSVGTPEIRVKHREKLLEYLQPVKDKLPKVDREKITRNPLRLFDSKLEITKELMQNAPLLSDFLDENCRKDFEQVQAGLKRFDIDFIVDPRLVRGLDYYTKTAYELKTNLLGAQDALGGGGRYDLLIEELGGKPTPAIGFACGMERILLVMEQLAGNNVIEQALDLFIVAVSEQERAEAIKISQKLREKNISVDLDYLNRSMKAQMKEAARQNSQYALLIFEDDIAKSEYQLKDLKLGVQEQLSFEAIINKISD